MKEKKHAWKLADKGYRDAVQLANRAKEAYDKAMEAVRAAESARLLAKQDLDTAFEMFKQEEEEA